MADKSASTPPRPTISFRSVSKAGQKPAKLAAIDSEGRIFQLQYAPQNGQEVEIQPGEERLLPTGVQLHIPEGYVLQVGYYSRPGRTDILQPHCAAVASGLNSELVVKVRNDGGIPLRFAPGQTMALCWLLRPFAAELVEAK